ncbi:endonuclease Q family protein [Ureibacillus sp. MALMAid1270]|uniref:endonuclease Q family protein n=1 Tax=Ureibacillus sp. MALMAid1270 TaxID=3411629 RepID=UPI003BA55C5A
MNQHYFADLHIHIGRTENGKPVKITGSRNLTLKNILDTASSKKGLDIIGIIDCHSPEVIGEIEVLLTKGEMEQLSEGGLRYENTTLIPGSEIEIYDENCQGPIHVLAYFPTISIMKEFSNWMSSNLKNIQLSSQRIYCDGLTLQRKVKDLGGLFIPAHVFTPFKSLYGKGVSSSLTEVFDPALIDGIELGLSSDTDMVKRIGELEQYTFVTNSDAHSLGKLAREYQKIELKDATFREIEMALQESNGRKIVANYGLNPLLGKYHSTACANCSEPLIEGESVCRKCGSKLFVKGVSTRIQELSDLVEPTRKRPPYIHQVPLDFIPGIGPKMIERLLSIFGTEMNILHTVTREELEQYLPQKIAKLIDQARKGELTIDVGGAGKYGKVH